MRSLLVVVVLLAGCAELGMIADGTSVSKGLPSAGYLADGARLPDQGEGFVTREIWKVRDNRYGTDELLDLITGVGRRMATRVRDVRLVVADLSGQGGGASRLWHRSHQSGRDVDLLYYMRDAGGQPFEADAMHVLDPRGKATDGTGLRVDVARTWLLVRELVTAPEAPVQWVFMYEPIAAMLLEHAANVGEPEALIARARKTLKQPGDSAPHSDHMHVRVYCSTTDKRYGCMDMGPMELLAEREAERDRDSRVTAIVATLVSTAAHPGASSPSLEAKVVSRGAAEPAEATSIWRVQAPDAVASRTAAPVRAAAVSGGSAEPSINLWSLGQRLRTRTDRAYLRRWR